MYCDNSSNERIRKHRSKTAGAGIRRYLYKNVVVRFKAGIRGSDSAFGSSFCANLVGALKVRKDVVVWSLVLALMAAIAVGDVEPVVAEGSVEEGMEVVDVSVDRTIQSISFKKDIRIVDALRFLSAKYQKNIVPSPNVDGIVTVSSLYNVTFEEAMEAILGYGFKYDRDANFIRVYTAEEYTKIKEDKSRMVYKVFTLYYINAKEVRKLISPVLSSAGKIETTTPAGTGVPVTESITADSTAGDSTAMNDVIIVYDYPENLAKAADVIASIDIRPKQVLIEAAILSITLTEDTQFGIDWQTLKGTISSVGGITRGQSDFFSSSGTSQVTKSGGLTFGFAHGNIAGFIKAVEEISDVTILARPKILTVNKQLGQVFIGTKLGYREGDVVTDGGATQEGTVKFLDTGTKLSFRPYIGNDGYIRMDIHPKDSTGSLSSGIPQETSAELSTNIIVKDGETIVIGGMFRDKITANETKIPILGDLPFIGSLFKGTADKNERQEVVILITPHIIEEPSEMDGFARAEDVARIKAGASDSLMWIGRSRLAEDNYAEAVKYYIAGDNSAALKKLNTALNLYPTHLDSLRLKDRIAEETDPEAFNNSRRIQLEAIDEQEAPLWRRR